MCGLSLDLVTKYNLHEGDEITQDEIDTLLFQEEKAKIRTYAFRLLAYRDRSSKEMQQRLIDKGFDKTLVHEIIVEFLADDTLNNERFARAFVHDYTHVKPRGNIFIQRELRKKGIPVEMIESILEHRDERNMIRDYLARKMSDVDVNDFKVRQKMVHRLLNQGFSSSLVYDIINAQQRNHEEF